MNTKLADTLEALAMTRVELARLLGCNERLVRTWVAGGASPPPAVLAWLAACQKHRNRHPMPRPPVGWKRRVPRPQVMLSDLKHVGGSPAEPEAQEWPGDF